MSAPNHPAPLHIALLAGEESGDILGAGLIRALKNLYPQAQFSGIGGQRMLAEGFHSYFPQDRLAVMGFIEPLKRLPELLRMRAFIKRHYSEHKPDVFIGIDSPDFNLSIERHLRAQGIKTAHYVSPSVWAWRQGRIHGIKKAVDLMLALFPFELPIYQRHQIPAEWVGHPLADSFPLETDAQQAFNRLALPLNPQQPIVALLPGSRQAEVARLGNLFFETAQRLRQQIPQLQFICPAANPARLAQLKTLLSHWPQLPVQLVLGQSHDAMACAQLVIMASGTTTLEALLLKKPMVIAYKVAPLSYAIYKRLVKVKHIGLPNLLTNTPLVPEFIQHQATADNLCAAALAYLQQPELTQALQAQFLHCHLSLRKDASTTAAKAIATLLQKDTP